MYDAETKKLLWNTKFLQDNIDGPNNIQTDITLFEALLPSPHGMCYILTSLISRIKIILVAKDPFKLQ